jgi:hypothetical protein
MVENDHKMTPEKRSHKMKITASKLRKIIIEEYIKEEGLVEADQEEIENLLKKIQGDKYRPPEERDPARYKTNDGNTAAMDMPHTPDSTMAMDVSSESAPVADQIADLVKGMDPDDVAALFQSVFGMLPGVEMQDAEPESMYTPGAEGRPQVGFRLEELKALIREMLANPNNV